MNREDSTKGWERRGQPAQLTTLRAWGVRKSTAQTAVRRACGGWNHDEMLNTRSLTGQRHSGSSLTMKNGRTRRGLNDGQGDADVRGGLRMSWLSTTEEHVGVTPGLLGDHGASVGPQPAGKAMKWRWSPGQQILGKWHAPPGLEPGTLGLEGHPCPGRLRRTRPHITPESRG